MTSLTLILGWALIAIVSWRLKNNAQAFRSSAILTSTALFAWGSLVACPPAFSAPQMQEQPAAEQKLQAGTTSREYVGLEYVQGTPSGQLKSDQEIIDRVRDLNENLVVQSSNGSVLLSGTVEDRQTARSLVDNTKEIPGVVQVSYQLGLQQD